MSASSIRRYAGLVSAGAGVLAAGTVAGVLAQRRVVARRRAEAEIPLGSVRGDRRTVTTTDGVSLYAEVDQPASGPEPGHATVVFVHGFSLNLDAWHYQRLALRERYRLVLFDQRSHGRSGRSAPDQCTIDHLGTDLRDVAEELAPDGPLVLVGHSMGGMTILALAQLDPEWFRRRVVGVTLVSTSADGMGNVTLGLPPALARLLNEASPSLLRGLARAPRIVERGRRYGSPYAFALTRRLAFGGPVPQELVDFTDEMLSATPVDVLASFYPEFARLDKADVLVAGAWPPTTIVCGDRDLLTPVGMSRRMAQAVPTWRLVEVPHAGHLVMLECPEIVNAEIAELLTAVRG